MGLIEHGKSYLCGYISQISEKEGDNIFSLSFSFFGLVTSPHQIDVSEITSLFDCISISKSKMTLLVLTGVGLELSQSQAGQLNSKTGAAQGRASESLAKKICFFSTQENLAAEFVHL